MTAVLEHPETRGGDLRSYALAVAPLGTGPEENAGRPGGTDDRWLEQAYAEHGTLVYTFCRRRLPEDRAQDVTQDVFISAWRARHRFDPAKGSLGAWLMGIAKNRLVDNLRSEGRHADRRAELESAPHSEDPDVDRLGDRILVADALASLPEQSRSLIELAYFGQLTHEEIAAQTSMPLGTVKSTIRRGLLRIRHHLEAPDVR